MKDRSITVGEYMLEQGGLGRSIDAHQAYLELCGVYNPMPKGWRRTAALKLAKKAVLCWRRSGCQGPAPSMHQVVWVEKRGRRPKVPAWAVEMDKRDD